jgi:hypothetical protein
MTTSSTNATNTNKATRSFLPMRTLPGAAKYKKGDVLVVFGELFSRGYANGIVDEAERAGLTVVRSTVGRREADGKLRALTAEEMENQPKPFINIPLEAGFDMEPAADGTTPVDQIKGVKMSEWENAKFDWAKVEESRKRATERFHKNVEAYMQELDKLIPKGANVIFLHTMAGGVPRAKILMPTMNRVFKGVGDRHLSSETFWKSELGRFTAINFEEVSANTFEHLINISRTVRERVEKEGGTVRYQAYGYHGTEVSIRGEYAWQSYAPYLQGWAKIKLEDVAEEAWRKGIKATVFNCPEILTNSSSIFVGVEVPLYPFVAALRKEGANSPKCKDVLKRAEALLKPEHNFDEMVRFTDEVLTSEPIRSVCVFEKWPQHNHREQMDKLIASSEKLIEMHQDPKNLITFVLSEEVFRSTGYVMYHESFAPRGPVFWLGHDILAKALATEKTL